MHFKFFNTPIFTENGKTETPISENSILEPLTDCTRFERQITINKEPDSLDIVLSNPQSYPITIIPNRPSILYGLTQNSNLPFNRQTSYSNSDQPKVSTDKTVVDLNGQTSTLPTQPPAPSVTDSSERSSTIKEVEKQQAGYERHEHKMCNHQVRQHYMDGTSNTPLHIGVYGAFLKTSSISLLKTSRNFRPGSMRKVRRRAVFKNGDCNVIQKNLTRRHLRFLQDLYTTLVDTQWRWTLLAFAMSFIMSWLTFAVLWWLIMYTHGDLEELHLPNKQDESDWKPCVSEITGFTSCFLFSIETQHTIGYGSRATSEECPEAIFMMCIQSIYGVMSSAFMAGIVFAKMTRAKQRAQTLLFSKHATICQRNGFLTLMFRVGDMRKSHIIGTTVKAQLIRTRTTREGEVMTQHFTELQVGADECGTDLFFIWPMIIEHKIDENSPLYNMSATDMLHDKFEIVVILEGIVESTGQSTQARSSYINNEILWGHRFDPVVFYNKDLQAYEIDYARFNETTQVDTPLCSARELNNICKFQEGFHTPETTFTMRQHSFNPSEHAPYIDAKHNHI